MPRLPRVSPGEAKKAFERAGFVVARQSGSHCTLKKDGWPLLITIPLHQGKTLGAGLLAKLIKNAGLSHEEFEQALRQF